MNLGNKNILFFAPDFFGYDQAIKKKLEAFGSIVDLYNERPSSNVFIKAIIRFKKELLSFIIERYFDQIIKKNKDKNYDYIFIIKGEVFSPKVVLKFKQNFPKAKIILYLFDSINNYKSTQESLYLFDAAYTFDKTDSQSFPELKFRPLFYMDEFTKNNVNGNESIKYKYDILFVGTAHSDRWIILEKIKKEAKKQNIKIYYYIYIQSPFVYLGRKLFDKKFKGLSLKDVHFKSISKEEIIKLTYFSKSVLDIQHPKQTGMTMRTFEVLGAERKLITTNQDVKQYDFYEPENILIIDRNNPVISKKIFSEKYIISEISINSKYSLTGWINEIFEIKIPE